MSECRRFMKSLWQMGVFTRYICCWHRMKNQCSLNFDCILSVFPLSYTSPFPPPLVIWRKRTIKKCFLSHFASKERKESIFRDSLDHDICTAKQYFPLLNLETSYTEQTWQIFTHGFLTSLLYQKTCSASPLFICV